MVLDRSLWWQSDILRAKTTNTYCIQCLPSFSALHYPAVSFQRNEQEGTELKHLNNTKAKPNKTAHKFPPRDNTTSNSCFATFLCILSKVETSLPRSLALCARITADPDRAGSQLAARSRGHLAAHHCATVISLRHTAAEGFSREEPEAQGPVPKAGALLEGGWKGTRGREDEVTAAGRAQTQCQAFSSSSSLLLYFPSPSPLAFLLAA